MPWRVSHDYKCVWFKPGPDHDEAEHGLQARTPQSTGEPPMTVNACGPSQDQIMKVVHQKDGDSSQVKQVPKAKLVIKKKIKKQSQGYNLGYFSLWWNRMDREGVKHALETKRMQGDARTSARLRMLLGASRDAVSDSTRDDNPEDSKTLPGTLLEGKAEIENEIHERPQDTNCERPENLSRIRKLSDANDGCQGCGKRFKLSTGDVFKNDGQFSTTLFVNTPGDKYTNYFMQSDPDPLDKESSVTQQVSVGIF